MGRLHRKLGCVGREKHEDFQCEQMMHFVKEKKSPNHVSAELQTPSARQGVKFPLLREEDDQEEHRDLASALRPRTVRPRGNLAKQRQTAARVM